MAKVSQETIAQGLSGIEKTADGATYAYSTMTLTGCGLTEINDSIQRYEHVRNLDLSGN